MKPCTSMKSFLKRKIHNNHCSINLQGQRYLLALLIFNKTLTYDTNKHTYRFLLLSRNKKGNNQ